MKNVFLTGATGFLGGQLIRQLLQQDVVVYILARNIPKAEKMVAQFPADVQHRVHIVEGDVTKPNCGVTVSLPTFDYFYHLAALVRFDEELHDEIIAINVHGTEHALQLAEATKAKHFFYVSTAYTVGQAEHGEEQLYPLDHPYYNPYEKSKIISERHVMEKQGEMNVAIFRPAIIIGDSRTGEADSSFTLYGFMRALSVFQKRLIRTGQLAPQYRLLGGRLGTGNLVPVNYVVDVLAAALNHAESGRIYHITNSAPPTNEDCVEMIKAALAFPELAIAPWSDEPLLTEDERKMNELIATFKPYLDRQLSFNDAGTRQLLAKAGVAPFELTADTLRFIIETYANTQLKK